MEEWRFEDEPMVAVITLRRILEGNSCVKLVTHDEDDGGWQFLDGDHAFEREAAVVGLVEVVGIDRSLESLHDLPVGWYAWRSGPNSEWQRAEGEPPADLVTA